MAATAQHAASAGSSATAATSAQAWPADTSSPRRREGPSVARIVRRETAASTTIIRIVPPIARTRSNRMQSVFRSALESQGAVWREGILAHFGDPTAERAALGSAATLHVLSNDGLLAASGADAEAFLQGQLSNDIRELQDARAQFTTWCTAQGRVLATFLAWKDGGTYLLQTPLEVIQPVLTRLRRFVLRARVALENASELRVLFGIAGPGSREALVAAVRHVPDAPMRWIDADEAQVLMLRAEMYHVAAPAAHAVAVWTALAGCAKPCGTPGWDWHRVHACLPMVTAATQDRFVPQMLDLEGTAVNFSKGCYPGQEIVARSQYLGQVKRRLFRVHADAERMEPGQEVSAHRASAGLIVNAAPAPHGGFDGLAVLQLEAAQGSLELDAHPLTVSAACH
jgi:tRNA-modifying protein YgfZ